MKKKMSVSKNAKNTTTLERSNFVNKKYPFDIPNQNDFDSLSYMSDDELNELNGQLNSQRNHLVKEHYPTYLWDIELAYVQRESMIRSVRKQKHSEYMSFLSQETRQFFETESSLPEFTPDQSMIINSFNYQKSQKFN